MRFLILFLALLLTGCDSITGPDLPDNAVPSEPHRTFAGLWAEVEADTGVQSDFGAISWYMVPGEQWTYKGTAARGAWVKDGNRIYISQAYWGCAPGVARHEMLHAILRDPSHDNPLFETVRYNHPWGTPCFG